MISLANNVHKNIPSAAMSTIIPRKGLLNKKSYEINEKLKGIFSEKNFSLTLHNNIQKEHPYKQKKITSQEDKVKENY